MGRKNRKQSVKQITSPAIEVFTFGDPIPVFDRHEIFDYLECPLKGDYYEPPISFDELARTFRAAPHHSSAIYVKRNILTRTFIPHKLLSRETFNRWVFDFLLFGNAYLELRENSFKHALALKHVPAKLTRRGRSLDTYWFIQQTYEQEPHLFPKGKVFHLIEPDVNQELYGLPEYLAGIPSVLLNQSSTLFRRKYYLNGAHAGYILYISDASQSRQDIDNIRNALKSSKSPGNFRNLFLYCPGGKKDGVQIIPLSEAAAKDEFLNIKNISRDDMLAAHRVPLQLLGMASDNVSGLSNIEMAVKVFVRNELIPLQSKLKQLNEWMGEEVVRFGVDTDK